MRRERRTYNWS